MTLGGGSAMERSDRKFHDAIRRAELYSGERLDQSCHFKSYQPGDVGLEHCDTVKSERQEFISWAGNEDPALTLLTVVSPRSAWVLKYS